MLRRHWQSWRRQRLAASDCEWPWWGCGWQNKLVTVGWLLCVNRWCRRLRDYIIRRQSTPTSCLISLHRWALAALDHPAVGIRIFFLCRRPGGIKRWCCLTSVCLKSDVYLTSDVCRVHPVGGRRVRIGWSGPARPARLKAAAARFRCSAGRGISWRPPAYSLCPISSAKMFQSLKFWQKSFLQT